MGAYCSVYPHPVPSGGSLCLPPCLSSPAGAVIKNRCLFTHRETIRNHILGSVSFQDKLTEPEIINQGGQDFGNNPWLRLNHRWPGVSLRPLVTAQSKAHLSCLCAKMAQDGLELKPETRAAGLWFGPPHSWESISSSVKWV